MYPDISAGFIRSISRHQFSFSLAFPKEEKGFENSGQDTNFNMWIVQAVSGLEKAAVDGIFSMVM